MRKVLITGANSYIGTSFERWAKANCPDIQIDIQDMIGDAWREKDFGLYDAIFHVAGIAHADVGSISEERKALYYKVNTDLTASCAQKAKAEGVKQFLFMSSMIVYGESAGIGRKKVITKETPLKPENFYGDSKVKAEQRLQELEDENFKVVILRPPMIYGRGAKGNYPLMARMAQKLPVFPKVENERSMLYIGNLCKFISLMIDNEEAGIFFPQNAEYTTTSMMVREIAAAHGKKICLTRLFHPLLILLGRLNGKLGSLINKAFGSIVYEMELSMYSEPYQIYSLPLSIQLTEKGAEEVADEHENKHYNGML